MVPLAFAATALCGLANAPIAFEVQNTTAEPMLGAWVEISYDPSLLDHDFMPGGSITHELPVRIDLPELPPLIGGVTRAATGRAVAPGVEHFVLTAHAPDGSISVASFDLTIMAPPAPPPVTPPRLVGGMWMTYGQPEQLVGHVYAFDAPDRSSSASVGCGYFNDAELNTATSVTYPGMPATRFILWKPWYPRSSCCGCGRRVGSASKSSPEVRARRSSTSPSVAAGRTWSSVRLHAGHRLARAAAGPAEHGEHIRRVHDGAAPALGRSLDRKPWSAADDGHGRW